MSVLIDASPAVTQEFLQALAPTKSDKYLSTEVDSAISSILQVKHFWGDTDECRRQVQAYQMRIRVFSAELELRKFNMAKMKERLACNQSIMAPVKTPRDMR